MYKINVSFQRLCQMSVGYLSNIYNHADYAVQYQNLNSFIRWREILFGRGDK